MDEEFKILVKWTFIESQPSIDMDFQLLTVLYLMSLLKVNICFDGASYEGVKCILIL